ncbi:MAG: sulfatase activating formylglycine-generating enzyme [Myxococcota bacterium]|jgi:formylglycine-generating enzyme required for sulfatase activity
MLLQITLSIVALAQAPQQFSGFVAVPSGETTIGAELETTIERILDRPLEGDVYAGECPRQSQFVDAFFISPTLVTNEMYLAFVKSTDATPPPLWAKIDKELRQEIIKEGVKLEGPGYKFDEAAQAKWWEMHWKDEGREWEMPSQDALDPVVFVSFNQAQKYCRWAGVRIPTETEWVRAARGDGTNEYPFGNEFNRSVVGHIATKPSTFAVKRLPVGMFPGNASPFGILDMSGQVHEFTDTPANKLKGFKSFKVVIVDDEKSEKRVIYPSPAWDQSRIILKGGSYMNPSVNCRIDSRIPFSREAAVPVVGFRIAASQQACRDAAYSSAPDLKSSIIGGNPQRLLDFAKTIGIEKHSWVDMSEVEAARKAPKAPLLNPTLPPEYAVLDRYAGLSITPLLDPFASGSHPVVTKIEKEAIKDGFLYPIGMLSTTVKIKGHDIEPGVYTLAFFPSLKAASISKMGVKLRSDKEDEGPKEIEIKTSFDLSNLTLIAKKEYVLVIDNEGVAIAAIQLTKPAKLKGEKSAEHGFRFNEKKGALDFDLSLAGSRGKVYWLQFTIDPVNEDGGSLSDLKNWLTTSYSL